MAAYYNEIDPYAAQWLRNLINAGHIAPGIVDERSIEDVRPSDIAGFTQCHFFAGIGVWSLALRRAGWPDDRPVWTGSCPCQPFSAAGQGAGFADERHLWPAFFHLISQRKPSAVFGEQVASKDAGPWIDLVHADLETMGYAFGAVPFPSASVGAPHIRDRLYWVANAVKSERGRRPDDGTLLRNGETARRIKVASDAERRSGLGGLANSPSSGRREEHAHAGGLAFGNRAQGIAAGSLRGRGAGRLEHPRHNHDAGQEPAACAWQPQADRPADLAGGPGISPGAGAGPTNGLWRAADWLLCRDGRWRPVEPGTFPLAHGAPARVGRLRAYGNAINAEAARVFIEATMTNFPSPSQGGKESAQ